MDPVHHLRKNRSVKRHADSLAWSVLAEILLLDSESLTFESSRNSLEYNHVQLKHRFMPGWLCLGIRHVTVVDLTLCGIEADFRPEHADTFRPTSIPPPSPFSDPGFFRKDDDVRWRKSGKRICNL